MTRKLCFVTGSRAEFGLLRNLIGDALAHQAFDVQLVVTGAHLSRHHGYTVDEIRAAGFNVDAEIDMFLGRGEILDVTQSISHATAGFGQAFNRLKPDVVILLGDRYEVLAAATAALIAAIPVAHLHGGETTEGAFDESIRHAVTKMSHLHFVANATYEHRVVQMGEQPKRVFNVGGLGVDAIRRMPLLDKKSLETELGFRFGPKNLLVTFHPVTNALNEGDISLNNLCTALADLEDTCIIFTMPNADVGYLKISEKVKAFANDNEDVHLFNSLGQLNYLSALQFVDGVVGNSSSGLAEAPTFGIGTINIGSRQKGRLAAKSVINCGSDLMSIREAFETLYNKKFRRELRHTVNPYGDGGASARILSILSSTNLEDILQKSFFDICLTEIFTEDVDIFDKDAGEYGQ